MDLDRIRNLIIGFALVSLIAAAGAIALYDFQINERSKDISSATNETIAHGAAVIQSYLYASTSACRNLTDQAVLELSQGCNITSTGTVSSNKSQTVSLDYTYYTPTHQMNITVSGLSGLDNSTSYFGTAGTIAGVALLLTIVIGSFYFITREADKGA